MPVGVTTWYVGAVAILVASGQVSAAQLAQSPDDSLRVAVQRPPTPDGSLELAVTNIGEKPVSAFRIRLGGQSNHDDLIMDLVPSFPSAGRSNPGRYAQIGPLYPGQVLFVPHASAGESGDSQYAISPTVLAIIFTDNKAVGDVSFARSIFEQRRGIADGLALALRYMRASRLSREDLESLRHRLATAAQGIRVRDDFSGGQAVGLTKAIYVVREVLEAADGDPVRLEAKFPDGIARMAEQHRTYTAHSIFAGVLK